MAQLDLKNCNFYMQDGYAGPAVTGHIVTGVAAGAATFTTAGFTGVMTVGDTFSIAGDVDSNSIPVVHTLTSKTDTSGNTTTINFTPVTQATVASLAQITVLPHFLRMKIGDGVINWTEKRPIVYVKDRGKLDTARLGDQDPVEVKADMIWEFLTSASGDTVPTPEDVLKQRNLAATWVSSDTDPCAPYSVNLVIVYIPPCTLANEVYTLHDFRYEDLAHDFKTGMLNITGKCNVVAASVARNSYVG